MKKNIIFIIFIFVIFFRCSENKNYTIKGSFKVTDPTPVQLYYLTEESAERVDSVFTSNGTFEMSGHIKFAGVYLLKFFNDQSVYLIIHPGDKIVVDIDNTRKEISYYVENSPDSKRVKELTDKQTLLMRQIDELSRIWQMNPADTVIRRKNDSTYALLMFQHKQFTRNFIYESPKSLANILALYQNFGRKSQPLFDQYDDIDIFNFVDSILVLLYPETAAVKALDHEVNEIRQQIKQNKYIEKIVEEGRPFPAFKYTTIDDDTITAGITHDKSVLLYFWASWNPFSVQELLALNDFANRSRSDKITIITVSLDSSEKELRKFLSAHTINLPVVCDYKYWDSDIVSRYAVKRIPADIISNRQGLIVGIDIFGKELYNRITELTQ